MKPWTQRERKAFQRQTAVKLEYKNLLISVLIENLAQELKKQSEDNVVRWVGCPLRNSAPLLVRYHTSPTMCCFLLNKGHKTHDLTVLFLSFGTVTKCSVWSQIGNAKTFKEYYQDSLQCLKMDCRLANIESMLFSDFENFTVVI